jgi:phosphinothricin acetyltransferase
MYPAVGFKLGAWHDVGWWQLRLCEPVDDPPPPLSVALAQALPSWQMALDAAHAAR